ncbi:MAG: carboxypeptidase-like regulatory domain-containing protein [Silvibacterium sp.]
MKQSIFTYASGFIILLALLMSGPSRLHAQLAVTTATLSGSITDPTGAVIPQATVKLTSTQIGISRTVTSDAAGRYTFTQLPPANYTLSIQANGFKAYQQTGITLDAAQSATQDVALTVGAATQQVTVNAEASQLNTDNANVASSIDAKQIVELPLNSRNIYGLITLNSSVNNTSEGQMLLGGGSNSTDNADQDVSFLNFAGGFFGTTGFMLDGSWDTDPEWGAVIYVPSVDAVQEFKIQNNSFTAQYGWSTGNVVNVVTKSGTSSFHGDAYEFYRNENLDANQWFADHAGTPIAKLSRNQFGVSAGGPLDIPKLYRQREKTFVFGLYEHYKVTTPTIATYTVPDSNFLNGDFSEILGPQQGVDDLGRPIYAGQIYDPRSAHLITVGVTPGAVNNDGQCNPSCYIRNPIQGNILSNLSGYVPDPVGAKLLSYYPKASGTGLSNNLIVSASAPAVSDEYLIRVDHNISNSARAYFRYSYKKETKTGSAANWGDNPAGPGNQRPNNRWGMWAGLSQVFTPTFTMNIAAGVQIWHETSDNQSFGFDPSGQLGLPGYVSQTYPLFPIVDVGSQSPMGPGANDQQAVTNHGPIGSVAVDFIKVFGKHTFNFGFMGVEQVDSQHNYFQDTLQFNGGFTTGPNPSFGSSAASGNGVAEMLLGTLDSASVGTAYNPLVSNHLLGEYVQDDWRPIHNLTLNLGLRYEIQTPDTYRHNEASIFNPDTLNPISYAVGSPYLGALQFLGPGNRYAYNTNYDNLAPRLGLSYQVRRDAVIHGGYGIFYPQSVTCCFPGDQDGFAATTFANTSLNGGINPNPTISTSNPWNNTYNPISGNSLGEYQQLGNGTSSVFRNRQSPYVQQWLLGVQYAITPNDSLDINYLGNRGTRMIAGSYQHNQLNPTYLSMGTAALQTQVTNPFYGFITSSSCNLNNATVQQAQLLVPYPQFCLASVGETDAPVGFSDYNALQVTYNHRISKGLTAMISYTYSKFLDNVEGNQSWSYNGNSGPANNYNLAAEKSVDGSDIPHSLVASYIYQLPVGRGKTFGSGMGRAADAVLGGWELSGIATFKSGIPISISGNNINTFGGDPRPDYSGNIHVSHPTIQEWFNTGAFHYSTLAVDGGDTWGNTPRFFSDLRGPRYQDWDTSLDKNWVFRETMRFQFRFETYNTFNHPSFYSPSGTGYSGCDPNADASCPSNFGQITNTFPSRNIQLAGKFYW